MAKRSTNGKGFLKALLFGIIGIGFAFLLFLLVVVFGTLLPAADPNLATIQSYIDWCNSTLNQISSNVVIYSLLAAILGGTGVVTYMSLKSK